MTVLISCEKTKCDNNDDGQCAAISINLTVDGGQMFCDEDTT